MLAFENVKQNMKIIKTEIWINTKQLNILMIGNTKNNEHFENGNSL